LFSESNKSSVIDDFATSQAQSVSDFVGVLTTCVILEQRLKIPLAIHATARKHIFAGKVRGCCEGEMLGGWESGGLNYLPRDWVLGSEIDDQELSLRCGK